MAVSLDFTEMLLFRLGCFSSSENSSMLIILAGLPGTGKTTIARALAARIGAAHVRVDTIEQGIKSAEPHRDVGATGYVIAYRIAADNLRAGLTVVADCVNAERLPGGGGESKAAFPTLPAISRPKRPSLNSG